MSYTFQGRTLAKVGVIGSGQIGPDIALHFAKVLAPSETPVVVVDISAEALERGEAKVHKKVDRGVESGAFTHEMSEAIKNTLTFTSDYGRLEGASLVVEAATEDPAIKGKIFSSVERSCPEDAILLSNSSHLEPEAIFAPVSHKGRTAVAHYFFPAERNRALELVAGAETDPEVMRWLMAFYEAIGKVPVRVGSRYGYAIDPLFEGLLQTSALLVEQGVATSKQVDAVARRALGLGVGPFTAHNLTGGNPITAEGLARLHEKVHPWFQPPASLLEKVEKGEAWEVPGRGEEVAVDAATEERVARALQATFFGLSAEVIDSGILGVGDLEMAVAIALVIDPPFAAMNAMGTDRALAMVEELAAEQPGFPVARCLKEHGEAGRPWHIPYVLREDRDGVAVLTIRRPRVLNALNKDVFAQLGRHVEELKADDSVKGVVVTGYGTKAFVSGADVGFLAAIRTPEEGIQTSLDSQRPLNALEALGKPVVCAMNGLAFGGGNELAMACHARLCARGIKPFVAQPEVNLGIIPGAGGSQRLPRLIGLEKAAELLRTGRPISSNEAVSLGLVRDEVEGDVVAAAVELARRAAAGEVTLEPCPQGPLTDAPGHLPDADIGHRSEAIDAILCRAILEGAAMPLLDGIRHEAELFGEVVKTKDMRIGVSTFLEQGPRAKAAFVHE